MKRHVVGVAKLKQRGQNRRAHRSKRRTADARVGVGLQNCRYGPFIIPRVTLRLESVRTPPALADVRFIGHFPEPNAMAAFAIMPHQPKDKFLPRSEERRVEKEKRARNAT